MSYTISFEEFFKQEERFTEFEDLDGVEKTILKRLLWLELQGYKKEE